MATDSTTGMGGGRLSVLSGEYRVTVRGHRVSLSARMAGTIGVTTAGVGSGRLSVLSDEWWTAVTWLVG